jgi:hypothetical protein
VDPSAPLPTLGAVGVTPGMPSGVPQGSITIMSTSSAFSASQNSSTYSSTVSSSSATGAGSTTSGAAASATSQGAAGRVGAGPFLANNAGLMGTVIALLAVGAGVVFWL